MKKLIIPLFLITMLGLPLLEEVGPSKVIKRGIASAKVENEKQKKKDETPDELLDEDNNSPDAILTTGTSGNDCVECRLAEMKIQNLYSMIEVYAVNESVLAHLNQPTYNNDQLSIMEQMDNFSNHFFATNPLVTGSLNEYSVGHEGPNHNSLSLSLNPSGYGFDYNSYLGIQEAEQLSEPEFKFEAPAMDASPQFRRMGQFEQWFDQRDYNFGGQNDSVDALISDSVEPNRTDII